MLFAGLVSAFEKVTLPRFINEKISCRLAAALSDLEFDLGFHQTRIGRLAAVYLRRAPVSAGGLDFVGDCLGQTQPVAAQVRRLDDNGLAGSRLFLGKLRVGLLGREPNLVGADGGVASDDSGVRFDNGALLFAK